MKTHLIVFALVLSSAGLNAQDLISAPASAPTPAEQVAQDLVDIVNQEIKRRVMAHQIAFAKIWRHPKASAADSLKVLGTRAALVFAFANENLEHIDRCARLVGKTRADFISDADCIPPLAFTAHADGTITLD